MTTIRNKFYTARNPRRETILDLLQNRRHADSFQSIEDYRRALILAVADAGDESRFNVYAPHCECGGLMVFIPDREVLTVNPPRYSHRCTDCGVFKHYVRQKINE